MGQRSYFVDVKISDTSILSNTGNVANFAVMHYNTIHVSITRLERVTVSDNKVQGIVETSRGAGLTVLVVLFFDSLDSLPQSQGDISMTGGDTPLKLQSKFGFFWRSTNVLHDTTKCL